MPSQVSLNDNNYSGNSVPCLYVDTFTHHNERTIYEFVNGMKFHWNLSNPWIWIRFVNKTNS